MFQPGDLERERQTSTKTHHLLQRRPAAPVLNPCLAAEEGVEGEEGAVHCCFSGDGDGARCWVGEGVYGILSHRDAWHVLLASGVGAPTSRRSVSECFDGRDAEK